MRHPARALVLATALAAFGACHRREPEVAARRAPAADAHDRELARLLAFEDERRARTDFAALPPSDQALGADPYRIAALPGGHLVGLLRGESAIVLLDARGEELARLPAPRTPGGLAVSQEGDVLVVGEAAGELAHYRATGAALARVATLPVEARGLRDVALSADARAAYLVEEREGRLLELPLTRTAARAFVAGPPRELGRCHGPTQVAALDDVVAVDCLLDHAIEVHRPGRALTRIHHDGPIWRFALERATGGGALIAAGGVEDHPLVREDGGFGYIDSYLYLYLLGADAAQPTRLAAINSSALGVVTPKWLALRADPARVELTVTGYASARAVALSWRAGDLAAQPELRELTAVPGTNDAALTGDGALVSANPLLDAWVVARGDAPRVVPVASAQPARAWTTQLGELLFFTTLMAPWNSSDGKLSRFTCETCHHEGYVDGRVHYTGRGDVHAATRPLYGLFNNRPYFSRALDLTMTQMVHAEFRVANRHNGRDPWFTLTRADAPWLGELPGVPAALGPEVLREAFMAFLIANTHRANPAAVGRAQFTERERAGAAVFRDRCASCHAARLVADQRDSEVAFARWESLVLSPAGPIVWSNAEYAKTGVTPYVHDRGARVPTLRRLYKKWPYFTNGRARSLAELLDQFATVGRATYHAGAPADAARLTRDETAALREFLALL